MSPVVFLGLCLAAVLLPLLVSRSLQRVRPDSWEQVAGGVAAWIWIIGSVLAMGALMFVGYFWRTGAGRLQTLRASQQQRREAWRARAALSA